MVHTCCLRWPCGNQVLVDGQGYAFQHPIQHVCALMTVGFNIALYTTGSGVMAFRRGRRGSTCIGIDLEEPQNHASLINPINSHL